MTPGSMSDPLERLIVSKEKGTELERERKIRMDLNRLKELEHAAGAATKRHDRCQRRLRRTRLQLEHAVAALEYIAGVRVQGWLDGTEPDDAARLALEEIEQLRAEDSE